MIKEKMMGLVAALLIVKETPVNLAVPSGNGNMFERQKRLYRL